MGRFFGLVSVFLHLTNVMYRYRRRQNILHVAAFLGTGSEYLQSELMNWFMDSEVHALVDEFTLDLFSGLARSQERLGSWKLLYKVIRLQKPGRIA